MKQGESFILGFEGLCIPDSLKRIAKKYGLGGVILYDRNIESPEQVKELTTELRSLSTKKDFIISVDQEGGKVQRLKPPKFEGAPPASEVNLKNAVEVGKKIGRQLADLGFNLNYAPVLDVNSNPKNPIIGDRAFSSDSKVVAEVAGLFIKGMEGEGVMACGKHFPGHGDTTEDSHLTLPVVKKSCGELEECEIYPFKSLIRSYRGQLSSDWGTGHPGLLRSRAGKKRDLSPDRKGDSPLDTYALKYLMTAHVLYPALDPENPATFSRKIITDLLRKKLGFKGKIITDDLCMAGSLACTDLPNACVRAYSAGCDLLLVAEQFDRHEEIMENLKI